MKLIYKIKLCIGILKADHLKGTEAFLEGYKAGLYDGRLDVQEARRICAIMAKQVVMTLPRSNARRTLENCIERAVLNAHQVLG